MSVEVPVDTEVLEKLKKMHPNQPVSCVVCKIVVENTLKPLRETGSSHRSQT